MGTQTLIWARAVSAGTRGERGHARPARREAQPGLGRAVAVAVDVDAAAGQAGQGTVAVRGDRGSRQAGGGRPGLGGGDDGAARGGERGDGISGVPVQGCRGPISPGSCAARLL